MLLTSPATLEALQTSCRGRQVPSGPSGLVPQNSSKSLSASLSGHSGCFECFGCFKRQRENAGLAHYALSPCVELTMIQGIIKYLQYAAGKLH